MANHLAALSLPPDDAVAYLREVQRQADACQKRDEFRLQIYSASFAVDALLLTVVRLTRSREMSPRLAGEMFGAGPRHRGSGVFLFSSPRLCDHWHTPEKVEEILGSSFILCYLFDLLERGCEAEEELAGAAHVLEDVVIGWSKRLNRTWLRVGWGPVLKDIARALVYVSSGANSPPAVEALARDKDAADGLSRAVATALNKYPWVVRAKSARSKGFRAVVFSQAPSSGEIGAEPAQASPELVRHSNLKRRRAPSPATLDASETVGAACDDNLGRRDALFLAAGRLSKSCIWLDARTPSRLRLALVDGRAAASKCRGMNLGAVELGPAFGRITFFVRAACGLGLLSCGSVEEVDLVMTAVDCGAAMGEAMGIPGSFAAVAHPALVAAACTLISLSGVLRNRAHPGIDERIVDTASDSNSASDSSSSSDSSSASDSSAASDSDAGSTGHGAGAGAALSSS